MILTDMSGNVFDIPESSMTEGDSQFLRQHIKHTNYGLGYEGIETGLFKKYLDPTDSVVEIGGGIGVTSVYIDKIIKGQHLVYEANDNVAVQKSLLNTRELNKCKYEIVFSCVVPSGKSGYTFDFSGSFFAGRLVSGKTEKSKSGVVEFSNISKECNVLVMDAEGLEYLLSGADLESMTKYDKVFMEFHHKYFPEYNLSDTMNFIDAMKKNGFQIVESIENHIFFRRSIQ